jgi:hypothetical protein
VALIAQIAGAVFLYLDYSEYPKDKKPPMPTDRPSVTATKDPGQPQPPEKGKDKGGM